jgi:3-carboxy-cis,cis-muconate cycloisomerase
LLSSDPLSPAAAGADGAVDEEAIVRALVDVELAYLRALVSAGIAPQSALDALLAVPMPDARQLAEAARGGGNPVIPLIAALRGAVGPDAATWVHRGPTSQDILDSALMLLAQRARVAVLRDLDTVVASLARLAAEHRGTLAAARTLTQHSTPTTWGLRFANWLEGVLDARDALAVLTLPAQLGGASGTLASFLALGADGWLPVAFAAELGLDAARRPWHGNRTPVTRLGDALTEVTGALGRIGTDVATLARTEIGEISEAGGEGIGGSSAMPHKQNPVRSVLLRSIAMRAPGLNATLHLAAGLSGDERPDGAWHAEWPTLRDLLGLALGAASTAAELTAGLTIDAQRVAANLALTGDDILSERLALTGTAGTAAEYLGLTDAIIDETLARTTG